MDNLIGKRLDGRYSIEGLGGVGGMANVYRGTDLKTGNRIAVKVLKEEFLDNEELVRRFKNESKAISILSHPNIVKVYDVSVTDKLQYIVMEYVDGITLKEYIIVFLIFMNDGLSTNETFLKFSVIQIMENRQVFDLHISTSFLL